MEQNIKEQLIKSVSAIKSKLKQIQEDNDKLNLTMNKVFKPVAEPIKVFLDSKYFLKNKNLDKNITQDNENLSDISNSCSSNYQDFNDNNDSFIEDKENNIIQIPKDDIDLSKSLPLERSLNKEDLEDIYEGTLNIPFGVRKENSEYLMGNAKVNLKVINAPTSGTPIQIININAKNYELTPGLRELLLRKTPNLSLVTSDDQKSYRLILIDTNAHKRNYDSNGQIKGDRSNKYREIIKPLFLEVLNDADSSSSKESKLGGGLPTLKKYKPNTEFVFWDDPNELIERLKMLIASRDSGNNSHDNEILSIIEELKEAGIIKE